MKLASMTYTSNKITKRLLQVARYIDRIDFYDTSYKPKLHKLNANYLIILQAASLHANYNVNVLSAVDVG
jgi:hypothetical protein